MAAAVMREDDQRFRLSDGGTPDLNWKPPIARRIVRLDRPYGDLMVPRRERIVFGDAYRPKLAAALSRI